MALNCWNLFPDADLDDIVDVILYKVDLRMRFCRRMISVSMWVRGRLALHIVACG